VVVLVVYSHRKKDGVTSNQSPGQ